MDFLLAQRVSRTGRRLATLLRVLVYLSITLGIALLGVALLQPELLMDWMRESYPQVVSVNPFQILLLAGIALGQLALTVTALWSLSKMFDCVARDEPLSLEAASHMRRASRWLLAATLYAMLAQIPASFVVSLYLPQGARFISVGLSSSHASGVLASLVLYAVASIQELAAQVREDNRQII